MNVSITHALAAVGIATHPSTFAGGPNGRPPVASWQIRKASGSPATAPVSVELVTLPVRTSLNVVKIDASKFSVGLKITVLKVPRRMSVRELPGLSEHLIPAVQFKAVRC